MKNSNWIRITVPENIPLREGRVVVLDGREIAVFNLGERFVALENRCPHRGGPLADGILTGDSVVCPLHARKVCLKSGTMEARVTDGPQEAAACVQTFPVRIHEGFLDIQIPIWTPVAVPLQAEVCNAEVA